MDRFLADKPIVLFFKKIKNINYFKKDFASNNNLPASHKGAFLEQGFM
jgi:hypothetical protein